MPKLDTYQQWVKDGEVDSQLAVIQSLSMQGFTREEIAHELGIGTRTLFDMLQKHPAAATAMKNGRRAVVALLQQKLLDKVQEGDTTAIIYGLKVYGGDFFNDRFQLKAELTAKVNGTMQVELPRLYLPKKDEDDA